MYTNAVLGEGKCVLSREVSLLQGVLLERFHSILQMCRCIMPILDGGSPQCSLIATVPSFVVGINWHTASFY